MYLIIMWNGILLRSKKCNKKNWVEINYLLSETIEFFLLIATMCYLVKNYDYSSIKNWNVGTYWHNLYSCGGLTREKK